MLDRTDLIAYVGAVHARTFEAVALLRDEDLGWRPRAGEFTAAELVLHIARARRMNASAIEGLGWRYGGHHPPAGATLEGLREVVLRASKKTIAVLHAADLDAPVRLLSGGEAPRWRLVMGGLIEHEVHHRSQLCDYLGAIGLAPPPLYGLHAEDLPRR